MPADVQADLAYLRDMADAGRRTPLITGRFAIMWGLLYTPPPFLAYAILTGALDAPNWILLPIFWAPLPLGALGCYFLNRQARARPGASSFINKANSAVWSAAGAAIGAVFLAVLLATTFSTSHLEPGILWGAGMAVIFPVYGVAYATTAFLAGFRGQALFAGLSFLAAGLMVMTIGQFEQFLVFGFALPIVTVLPGLVMEINAPKETV